METEPNNRPINDSIGANSSEKLAAAAVAIERFRRSLDWMLTVPDWEEAISDAAIQLGAKLKRQGIGQRRALLSMPIELKSQSIRDGLRRSHKTVAKPIARKLSEIWGITTTSFHRSDSNLSQTRWFELRNHTLTALAKRHTQYKQAQNLLFRNFQTLSSGLARKMDFSRIHIDDCIQEGNIGLLEAIDRVNSNTRFAGYAKHWISRRIRNFLLKESIPLSAPINAISKARLDSKSDAMDKLPKPSLNAILDFLDGGFVSFDDDYQSNSRFPLHESLPDSNTECPIERANETDKETLVNNAVSSLSSKQRQTIELRFGLIDAEQSALTHSRLASALGISRQQVARREQRAMANLQKILQPLANELSST